MRARIEPQITIGSGATRLISTDLCCTPRSVQERRRAMVEYSKTFQIALNISTEYVRQTSEYRARVCKYRHMTVGHGLLHPIDTVPIEYGVIM